MTARRLSVFFTFAMAVFLVDLRASAFMSPWSTVTTTTNPPAHVLAMTAQNTGEADLKRIDQSRSVTEAKRILEKSLGEDGRLFGSVSIPAGASTRILSDADLAIQTRLANNRYKITDLIDLSGNRDADRASLSVLSVFVSSSVAAVIANQNLPGPEIVRFVVVWLLVFAPLFFVGYGIRDAEALQALLVQVQRQFFPTYRKRMLQHEAGHFLMAHLVGFPIQGYQANAVKNSVSFFPLADTDRGPDFARQLGFDRPSRVTGSTSVAGREERREVSSSAGYYSKEGSGARAMEQQSVFRGNATRTSALAPPEDDPSTVWPFRGFNDQILDQLTVISVAGVCAEILAFGNSEGGIADFNQLKQIFSGASNEVTEREAENRIRFAIGYTITQLRLHLGVLDSLADAMESGASVADCVRAIESCSFDPNAQIGYEKERRQRFANEGILERTLLGDSSNQELWENQGKVEKAPAFALTGDDPIYLAVFVAFAFFVWASSGGLSLH